MVIRSGRAILRNARPAGARCALGASLLLSAHGLASGAEVAIPVAELAQRLAEQARQLDGLKRLLAAQQAELDALRASLETQAARGQPGARPVDAPLAAVTPPAASAAPVTTVASVKPAPAADAPPAVPQLATIFQQPGVLTPRGRSTVEPAFQYSYASSSSVALVGYTVIPAILVGLIDVRDVKSSTLTGSLTWRYGLSERAEVEARLPYVYRFDNSISRAALAGSGNTASIFDADGRGVGDVEFTGRYQLNEGGAGTPYYIGSLRLKTRTGKDPFEIPIATNVAGFGGQGLQSELPTGSGFYGLQPALTMLYASDPAVFFGTVSALYSIKRQNVVRQTDAGPETLGSIAPGLIFGFNFGMGVALNERASFSIGYDHSSIGKTLRNGSVAADSVRLQLGTLLFGLSYRLDDRRSLSVSLGAGLTRDTPDVTLTLRVPTSL